MSRRHEFQVRHGLSQEHLADAAAIFYDSLEAKKRPLLRSREDALPVLAACLNPQSMIAALRLGTLVGVCELHQRGRRFRRLRLGPFIRQYGLLGGLARLVAFGGLNTRPPKDELVIETLAVRGDMRGRGIGTQLLEAAREYARAGGFQAVRLDVVDTNPDAQRLYERMGFEAIRMRRYPLTRRLAGFSAVITMRQPLNETA